MNVKNIIFDLGGIFIDLNYFQTEAAFKNLGFINFNDVYTFKKQELFFDEFDRGKIAAADFRKEIKKHLPVAVTDEQIDLAWNAMLIDIPEKRIKWLEKISKNYSTFLLSNTNTIHVHAFTEMLENKFGKNIFKDLFQKTYYSCEIGMRKPDAEIFEFVLKDSHLKKEETIFIDDSIQHVDGANRTGLRSFHLDLSKHTIQTLLNSVLGF